MRSIALPASLLTLFLTAAFAPAWLRPHYEDAIVVQRSELIVVAHLKEGSIEKSPARKPGDGGISQHHATLVISKVLKGECAEAEIPIIIHYGLTPIVSDGKAESKKGAIELHDTGSSAGGGPPLLKDARQDNLWFLRRRSGIYGREPGTGDFGIVDPQDVQLVHWQDYFLCYLSKDPVAAIRDYVQKNPDKGKRAKTYLDHLEVQLIFKEVNDPEKRYEALLPYFLRRTTWDMKAEARDGIVRCGKPAGARLKDIFADKKYNKMRWQIIDIWSEMRYRGAVPVLIEMLNEHDKFWAQQKLHQGWWNDFTDEATTERRRTIYSQDYSGVCALRSFRDPRSQDALELTRKRWAAIAFDIPQILEQCEAALRELAAK